MKFSSQEEYGLRCLIRIGKAYRVNRSLTIPEISTLEGLSRHNVAKLLRILRLGGFLESVRGQLGGYTLTRPPSEINLKDVLAILGGRLFDNEFCISHSGELNICTNSVDCSTRSLWKIIQTSVDNVVGGLSLEDMMGKEFELFEKAIIAEE